MTIRSAHRPLHPARPPQLLLRLIALGAALLAVALIAVTRSEPALARIARDLAVSPTGTSAIADTGDQTYTVPDSVQLPELTRTAEVTVVQGPPEWVVPASGALRDGFGPRPNAPVAGVSGFHRGQDIGAPCGAQIHAAASGRVVQAGWDGTYGNWVLLQHADGVQTGYAHAERLLVHAGQRVEVGAVIADVGSTGASSGCHLHFEVRVHDKAVDPVAFMHTHQLRLGKR